MAMILKMAHFCGNFNGASLFMKQAEFLKFNFFKRHCLLSYAFFVSKGCKEWVMKMNYVEVDLLE